MAWCGADSKEKFGNRCLIRRVLFWHSTSRICSENAQPCILECGFIRAADLFQAELPAATIARCRSSDRRVEQVCHHHAGRPSDGHEIMEKGVGVTDGEKYTVGRWLTFDPASERHTGEFAEEANALLKDPNRKGFEIPEPGKV
jgi:hypothetical protein